MLFLLIILFHFLADFVLQNHWMASNKSKSWLALLSHTIVYSIIMSMGLFAVWSFFVHFWDLNLFITFFVITLVTHTATDYFTSRASSKRFAKSEWHNFFVIVGFDQTIHYFTLYFTLKVLGIII